MADETMPEFEPDPAIAEQNALRNLIAQVGDPEAAHEAGTIDNDAYLDLKAKKLAYTAALDAYAKGETPDVPALLKQMQEVVAKPTQIEINTANIDYLLMAGGEA